MHLMSRRTSAFRLLDYSRLLQSIQSLSGIQSGQGRISASVSDPVLDSSDERFTT